MRHLAGFLLVLAAACGSDSKPSVPAATLPVPPTPKGATLHLPPEEVHVGDHREHVTDEEEHMTITVKGREVAVTQLEHRDRIDEVLAASGQNITSLKVLYREATTDETVLGKSKHKPSPVAGRTYVVTREGSGPYDIQRDDGSPVSPEERKAIERTNRSLGHTDVMAQIIGDRTWKVGEPYQFTDDDLRRLAEVSDDEAPRATAMSIELRGFDDKVAVFGLELAMTMDGDRGHLGFTLRGAVRMDRVHTMVGEMVTAGSLDGTVQGAPTTGTLKSREVYR